MEFYKNSSIDNNEFDFENEIWLQINWNRKNFIKQKKSNLLFFRVLQIKNKNELFIDVWKRKKQKRNSLHLHLLSKTSNSTAGTFII